MPKKAKAQSPVEQEEEEFDELTSDTTPSIDLYKEFNVASTATQVCTVRTCICSSFILDMCLHNTL